MAGNQEVNLADFPLRMYITQSSRCCQ